MGAIIWHTVGEPEFSGLGQNDFRPTLFTDRYCPLQCLYTIPSTHVMTVTIPGTHVSWCCQQGLWWSLNLYVILTESFSSTLTILWDNMLVSVFLLGSNLNVHATSENIQAVTRYNCHVRPPPKGWLVFNLWKQDTLERKFLSFWPHFLCLAYRKPVLFLLIIQQTVQTFCLSMYCMIGL
jgi:hypothetical protein